MATEKAEFSPREDGGKLPLADGAAPTVQEGMNMADHNGEAIVTIGDSVAFTGLTKQQLMEYSKDPFWIKMRWFLFILFWLIWVLMLVMAIVIIVKAPGCEPPPELMWLQESPIAEDTRQGNFNDPADLVSQCKALGVETVYFPGLISDEDFEEATYDITAELEALNAASLRSSTDLPTNVPPSNPLYPNASNSGYIHNDGSLNYENKGLIAAMANVMTSWVEKGISGFFMGSSLSTEELEFQEQVNQQYKDKGIAVGGNIVDLQDEFSGFSGFTPEGFHDFLEKNESAWHYYRFNPTSVSPTSYMKSSDSLRLATIGLYLVPGTPILQHIEAVPSSFEKILMTLAQFRKESAIKFGNLNFVNTTTAQDGLVAYTRVPVLKGTPAYAIALNFANTNTTVSFKDTPNVGESGTIEMASTPNNTIYAQTIKIQLDGVPLSPYEGKVLQFVAAF